MALVLHQVLGCLVVGITLEKQALCLSLRLIEVGCPTCFGQHECFDVGVAQLLHDGSLVGYGVYLGVSIMPEPLNLFGAAFAKPRGLAHRHMATLFQLVAPCSHATLKTDVVDGTLAPYHI